MPAASEIERLPSGGALHLEGPAGARAPPILFLHGVGGGAWSWAPQRELLRATHRCFTWEARGRGAAAPVSDARLADYLEDAREALAAVRASTGARALLVGHSMGALLALALESERPEAVRGLALIDPVYAESGAPPTRLPRPVQFAARLFMAALARSFARDGLLGRTLARLAFKLAFTDRAAMERAWAQQRRQVPIEYRQMLLESLEGVSGFPFQPFADRVRAPTLLIEALAPRRRSRFTALLARLRARLGEDAESAAVAGGHYLQLDRPDEVGALLASFAARLIDGAP